MITLARVRSLLDYNPKTGVFKWKVWRSRGARVGSVAGTIHPSGYRVIEIDNIKYRAHRLAWLLVYGKFPKKLLDHKNRKRSDNRITNLREVTHGQNFQNIEIVGGKTGAVAHAGKWQSQIKLNGKCLYLGRFATQEEAHQRYLEEKRKRHKFFVDSC
jgi:hypothetical protein